MWREFPVLGSLIPFWLLGLSFGLCVCGVEAFVVGTKYNSRNDQGLEPSNSRVWARAPAPTSGSGSSSSSSGSMVSRREWFSQATKITTTVVISSTLLTGNSILSPSPVYAATDDDDFFNDPEIKELYENPNIPQAPEERSGLVVLRVAEVAQFQEKILRSIATGEVTGVMVSPMQFLFGTQILLRNSNLDGNMRLMIRDEIPKNRQDDAAKSAAKAMNQLQEIAKFSGSIQRDFETIEMIQLADMYRNVRVYLNQLYDYLSEQDKSKYYGYFVAVTAYEKKIADGTYNPDLDGVLTFDDPREGLP